MSRWSFIENNISKFGKISDKEFKEVLEKITKFITPYENQLIIKISQSSYSFLLKEKFNKFETIVKRIYEIKNLFMCLSRYFRTNIDVLQINYEKQGKGYILFFDEIIEDNTFVCFPHNPFWLHTFNNKEWTTIFENLFQKQEDLQNFFSIISSNSKGEYITQHSLVKSIDGLKAIKKGTKTAYSDAIHDFKIDLSQKEQKLFGNFLDTCLNYVKLTSKQATAKDKLGLKISNLRAYVEHFYDYPNQKVKLETLGELISIFDLIICDYILKELGISQQKRLFYKKRILELMKIIPYRMKKYKRKK